MSLCLAVQSCKNEIPEVWIYKERIKNPTTENRGSLGGNYKQQHSSGLEQSSSDNVNDLGFATRNNYKNLEANFRYQTFEPRGLLNSFNIRLQGELNLRHSNND